MTNYKTTLTSLVISMAHMGVAVTGGMLSDKNDDIGSFHCQSAYYDTIPDYQLKYIPVVLVGMTTGHANSVTFVIGL